MTARAPTHWRGRCRDAAGDLEDLAADEPRIAGVVAAANPPRPTGALAASLTPSATSTVAQVDASVRYAGSVEARTRVPGGRCSDA